MNSTSMTNILRELRRIQRDLGNAYVAMRTDGQGWKAPLVAPGEILDHVTDDAVPSPQDLARNAMLHLGWLLDDLDPEGA